ncbi:MAG TPA: cytochrome P450 [Stellaceae bacterium]|jgi:cytochrome P450|nr:cytochrome P450 [Stellaceae bacterium]
MSAASLAAPPRFRGRMPLLRFLRTLRDSSVATYGEEMFEAPVIERRVLWQRYLIVNAPRGIERVLLDNAGNYVKSRVARRLIEPGIGRGLLTSEGDAWRRQRRTMAPSFDHRSLMSYAPAMTEAAAALLARWDRLSDGAPLDIAAEMMRLTLKIIARTMFSAEADDIGPIVEEAVGRYQREVRPSLVDLLNLPDWWPRPDTRRWSHIFDRFDAVIDRLVRRETAAGGETKDLLARLLEARDAETGRPMDPRELRDQVVTIFMAGHETTAQALTWTWYLLSQHPAEEATFHAELERVLGGRAPRFEDLARLRYTRMVLEESMRLYPPAHTMSREALAEDEIEGHRVAKGSVVSIVPWVIHRHRLLWDRPEVFDPERFAPERAAERPRFAYIPFGGGPRICIGASFAMTEALIILAMLGQRYRLSLAPDAAVEPVGLITLRPRHGLPMRLERR